MKYRFINTRLFIHTMVILGFLATLGYIETDCKYLLLAIALSFSGAACGAFGRVIETIRQK